MLRKMITYIRYPVLIAVIMLCLVTVAYAANINSTNKWAWGANVGWLNFDPTYGGGVTVYTDHLEGYVWAENIGWIRLGSDGGGGDPYYANTTKDNYGVNYNNAVDSRALSGYAWGTSVGWIKFDPTDGGVTIDSDGKFDGYAWGENVGWIHFQHDSPAYLVQTDTPNVVTLARFVALSTAGGNGLALPVALVALGAVGGMLLLRARRRPERRNYVEET